MARLNRNEAGASGQTGALATSTTVQTVVEPRQNRVALTLRNYGSVPIFISPRKDVTAATGYPLLAGEEWEMADYLGALHAVSETAGALRFWETY